MTASWKICGVVAQCGRTARSMELSGVFVNLMNQIFSHKSATGQSPGMNASDFEKMTILLIILSLVVVLEKLRQSRPLAY